MAEQNLNFSKIVSTPTPTAWSQAYSAGTLFAAFSLETDIIPEEGLEYLASTGKDLISTLESEFFTLENKDLESIKQALLTTLARLREGVVSSFVLCYLSDNVLYLFAAGGARAVLKRGEKIGTVLDGEENSGNIKTASGYVQNEDLIVLETRQFQQVIPSSKLASSLDKDDPQAITEELAPEVHEKVDGGAAAVVLIYKEGQMEGAVPPIISDEEGENGQTTSPAETPENADQTPLTDDNIEEISEEEPKPPLPLGTDDVEVIGQEEEALPTNPSPFLTDQMPKKSRFSASAKIGGLLQRFRGMPRRRRLIATVAAVLVVLILVISVLAITHKNGGQSQKLFDDAYSQAKSKYDEGENLKDLNAPLAQQSFKEAKGIIEANESKFKDGSSEKAQLDDLLTKVNSEITSSGGGESATATEVKSSESKLLSAEIDNSNASYFTQNDDYIYFLDGSGVAQIDKGNSKKTEIVKKTWKTDGGIGVFGSNVYVLDRADGINKLVPSGDTYANNDYFVSDTPDLTSSMAMGIDGSIYVLNKEGTIDKYTKGKSDSFSISEMDKALSGATRISTNSDIDNVYVLDNGNSRIVVLDKSGKFVAAYSAPQIKSAKDLDVDEVNKKIFILSSGKVYQIDIK